MNSVYSKLVKLTQNDWPKWQSTMNYVMESDLTDPDLHEWKHVKTCTSHHFLNHFMTIRTKHFFHLKHSWTQSLDIAVLVSWKSLLARSKPWNTFSKERENITYVCKIRKRKQSSKETWAWDEKNAVKCQRFWSISKLCSKFPCSCISFLVE